MEPSNTPSSPPAKYVALGDALYDYVARHRSRVIDPLLAELRAETESLGDAARMLISLEQGDFLTLLTKLLEVRSAIEVGTFTGYSSICLARGLAESGRLHCFDINADWTAIARRYWKKKESRAGLNSSWAMRRRFCRIGNRARRSTSPLSMPTSQAMTPISKFSCRR